MKQPIAINNNLKTVESNIAEQPSKEQIAECLKKHGVSFDPDTQYIQWYAIKYVDSNGNWHVDGVISETEKYSVTYHPNGGATKCPEAKKYYEGNEVVISFNPIPSRAGYKFLGWNKDKDAKTPTYMQTGSKNNFVMPAQDVDLYAIWEAEENVSYKVEHYLEREEGYTLKDTDFRGGKTDTIVNAVPKQYSGYTYDKTIDGTVSSGTVTADGTLVLKLYYKAAPAKIVFVENGGSDVMDLESKTGWKIADRQMPTTTYLGYTFEGWYADEELTKEVNTLPETFPAGTTTYYAKWSKDESQKKETKYTVKHVVNGIEQTADTQTYTKTVWINAADKLEIQEGSIDPKNYAGYKYESMNPEVTSGDEVADGTIITLNYVVDFSELSVNNINKVYDGVPSELEVTGVLPSDTIEYYVDNKKLDSNSFTNVTDEMVTVKVIRGTESTDLTTTVKITPRNLVINAAKVEPYNGLEQTLDITAENLEEGVLAKNDTLRLEDVKVVGKFAGDYTEVKNPGNYTITNNEDKDVKNNYIVTITGKLTITDKVTPDKVIKKSHDGDSYEIGDPINFTIKVTNIYNKEKTITITEQPGVELKNAVDGVVVFKNVQPGSTVEAEATYAVTEADVLAGGVFTNKAKATFDDGKEFDGEDTVKEISTPDPKLIVNKSVKGDEKAQYQLGDPITYEIIVRNQGNVTISDIVVTDELTGDTFEVGKLAPGEPADPIEVEYTVTEADILNGKVTNIATAVGTDSDGKKVSDEDTKEVTTESVTRSLDVTKTVTNTPANGTAYQVGESISYEVKVENTGNVTLENVQVADQMQGAAGNAELRDGESTTIAELAPDQTVTLHYVYTVRAADLGATLRNMATAESDGTTDNDTTPGEPVVPPTPTPEPDETPADNNPPADDDNPVITPAGNPAAPAGPAAVITAVTGAPAAVAGAIGDALQGATATVRELTNAGDEEVPLANTNLENEHKCCIFHFLVMLISMIVLAFFTRSMKKRQKEIFELREELDTELAKRGLPLSNEKQ